MKKSLFLLSILTMALLLKACGGGGGGTTAPPTPAPATVNLAAFKNVFEGTATGTQFNFPALTGTDPQGGTWSGSFTLAAGGAVTFEAQNVTNSVATLQLNGSTSVSDTTTSYFQINGTPYKSVSSTGGSSLPPALPTTAKVGDFAPPTTVTRNDGSTATSSWSLNSDPDGTPVLLISRSSTTGGTTTAEFDSYYLDAAGVPTKIMINVTAGGTIVTLTGAKAP